MRHPYYLELPFPFHTPKERGTWPGWRRHWWLIVSLVLLAVLLTGISVGGAS